MRNETKPDIVIARGSNVKHGAFRIEAKPGILRFEVFERFREVKIESVGVVSSGTR